MYFHADGIPGDVPREGIFWAQQTPDSYTFSNFDHYFPIETAAIRLMDRIGFEIFGSLERYHEAIRCTNPLNSQLGLDSDVRGSKEDFERWVRTVDETERRLLYYYDVIGLIGAVQDSAIRVQHLLGEFYKELNTGNFIIHHGAFGNQQIHCSGSLTTKIFSFVNHIFISLASQLDFVTKIVFEVEKLKTNFERYGRINASDILFGDAKRVGLNGAAGTIFDGHDDIKKIVILRNEIIHNGTFELFPKVYLFLQGIDSVEKFILFPDFNGSVIKAYGSRKRFYEDNTRLNLILPELAAGILDRVRFTLEALLLVPQDAPENA